MTPRRILDATLGLGLLCLAGCWNRVEAEDESGEHDSIILPKSNYRLAKPMRFQQTDSNIIITVIYERTTK